MKVSKIIALVAMVTVSTFASAATFGNYNACKEGNGGVSYEPTMHAKGYGPKRVAGLKLLPSEADACYLMTTGEGRRWAFFKKGTMVYIRNGKTVMVAECQNDVFDVRPIIEDEKPTTSPSQPPAQPSVVQNTTVIAIVETPSAPAVTPPPASECKDCTPNRKTEEGKGGWCRVDSGRTKLECNFEWKVLHTQDQVRNCGCQVFVPSTKQTIGFLDAQPGSARCLQQKKLWAKALRITYNDSRPPQ